MDSQEMFNRKVRIAVIVVIPFLVACIFGTGILIDPHV